jgi:hypothetical protein
MTASRRTSRGDHHAGQAGDPGAQDDFAKAVALQDWFRTNGGFRYSLEQRSGSGMDLLATFVTDDRVGYCEQFAAAMAAMGRALEIPSRVVVGFLAGTAQPDGGILYTSDDRHAWPEMYFSGVGWVRFEPTPGQRAGPPRRGPRRTQARAPPGTSRVAHPSRGGAQARQRTNRWKSGDNRGLPIPSWPFLALIVIAGWAGARTRAQPRSAAGASPAATPVHLAEGAWAELRATALDMGLDWPEERSPREQARRVATRSTPRMTTSVARGLLVRVERGRYAARGGGTVVVDPEVRSRRSRPWEPGARRSSAAWSANVVGVGGVAGVAAARRGTDEVDRDRA